MNEGIEKGIIIFLLIAVCFFSAMTWYAADKCIQLETQIRLMRTEMNFITGALERDLEVLEANLIRLKKGQW